MGNVYQDFGIEKKTEEVSKENPKDTEKIGIGTRLGLNPSDASKRDSMGSGFAEGICVITDPIGIPVQYFGRKCGYDIRTIGGIGYFSGAKNDIKNEKATLGSFIGKSFYIAGGIGLWLNPVSLPYMIGFQVATAAVNGIANYKRFLIEGTLELEKEPKKNTNSENSLEEKILKFE